MSQQRLFPVAQIGPPGFRYEPEFITPAEEQRLIAEFEKVPLKRYLYQGYESKRRVKSFTKAIGYPPFMIPILEKVARFIGVDVNTIEHALITEYSPGTAIGWHRDQPPYDKIIGISLGSSVQFRLRRKKGKKWERFTVTAEPRSLYVMAGSSRNDWQHSIPQVLDWRYSLTMRTVERVIRF